MPAFASNSKQCRDQLIEFELRIRRRFSAALDHVNAAAFAKLDPASMLQVLIRGAHGVRVNVVAACKLAGAWEFLARLEVVADDAEKDLRRELFAERNFAAF